jgi:hypothetical protein
MEEYYALVSKYLEPDHKSDYDNIEELPGNLKFIETVTTYQVCVPALCGNYPEDDWIYQQHWLNSDDELMCVAWYHMRFRVWRKHPQCPGFLIHHTGGDLCGSTALVVLKSEIREQEEKYKRWCEERKTNPNGPFVWPTDWFLMCDIDYDVDGNHVSAMCALSPSGYLELDFIDKWEEYVITVNSRGGYDHDVRKQRVWTNGIWDSGGIMRSGCIPRYWLRVCEGTEEKEEEEMNEEK